jgi:hypothetical protein
MLALHVSRVIIGFLRRALIDVLCVRRYMNGKVRVQAGAAPMNPTQVNAWAKQMVSDPSASLAVASERPGRWRAGRLSPSCVVASSCWSSAASSFLLPAAYHHWPAAL